MKLTDGHRGFVNDIVTVTRDINIFSISDIKAHELVKKCCDTYKNDGSVALLLKIESFITAIGGDDFYFQKLKTNYPDKEKEINEINNLLSIVDSMTLKKINEKYASIRSMHV